jgi:hypothetical protein
MAGEPILLEALQRPVVYLWSTKSTQREYFGQTERGWLQRTKEELVHALRHQRGLPCRPGKGFCGDGFACGAGAEGVHHIYTVPHTLVKTEELRELEDRLIQRYKPVWNHQFYWRAADAQPVGNKRAPYMWASGASATSRRRPSKRRRKGGRMKYSGQLPPQAMTVATDTETPRLAVYVATAHGVAAPCNNIMAMLRILVELGHTSNVRITRIHGLLDLTLGALGPRSTSMGNTLCTVEGMEGQWKVWQVVAMLQKAARVSRVLSTTICISKIKKPRTLRSHYSYRVALGIAQGTLTTASWGRLYKLSLEEVLAIWSFAWSLPTMEMQEIALHKLRCVCAKRHSFVPPATVRGTMPYTRGVNLRMLAAQAQALILKHSAVSRQLTLDMTKYIAVAFKSREKLKWRLDNSRAMCKKRLRGQKSVCGCHQLRERLRALGFDPPCVHGHVLFTFDQLQGSLRCFATVTSGTIPLPSKLTDQEDARNLVKKVVKAFSPIMRASEAKIWSGVKQCVYRSERWTVGRATGEMAVDDDKVEVMRWALQGAVVHCVDKNPGEFVAECAVGYFRAFDSSFVYGKGKSVVELRVKPFSKKKAEAEWRRAKADVMEVEFWEKEEVVCGPRESVEMLEQRLFDWQRFLGIKLGFARQAVWRRPRHLGAAFGMRKMKYTQPVVLDKVDKMRPVEDIGKSGWKVAQRAAAAAWTFLIARHTGKHFALTNISKFVDVAMEKQRNLRGKFGVNLGLMEITTDIADYFTVMTWDLVLKAAVEVLEAARERRVHNVSVEKVRRTRRRHVYFGTSASPCYAVFTLDDLLAHIKFSLVTSCVLLYADFAVRHANGISIPMGGILASHAAILGGMGMESAFDRRQERHKLMADGLVVLEGIRVQDDTKLLLGFDNRFVTTEDVERVFEEDIALHLYPPPFVITRDSRNRYLETVSEQEGSFVWYRHYNKNVSAWQSGGAPIKNGQHSNSYVDKAQQAATIVGHMRRVRGCCTLEVDRLSSCLAKLVELECEHSACKPSKLLAVLLRKAAKRPEEIFWSELAAVYKQHKSL